jgi:tetratricopeptide (TPR) repeat protein
LKTIQSLAILVFWVTGVMVAQNASAQSSNALPSSAPVKAADPAPPARATASVYVRQGDRAFAEGKYAESVEAYTKALELYNLNDYAYYNRGLAYRKLKDYKNAIADFSRTLQLNPENTFAYLYRGMTLQVNGQTDLAIADYTALIKIDESQPLAYLRRAEAYVSLKQNDKAREDFTQAASLYKRQGNQGQAERVQSQLRAIK